MMSFTFEETHKNLGVHKEGQVLNFIYTKIDNNREVVSLAPSCGCFNPIYNKEKGQVIVSYKVKSVPVHLKDQGFFIDKKNIVVTMDSGEKELLTFQMRVETDK